MKHEMHVLGIDIAKRLLASIMASATPFWCCATPKHLTTKSGMISKP